MCSWAAVMFGWVLSCIARLATRSRSQGWAQPARSATAVAAVHKRQEYSRRLVPPISGFIEQFRDVGLVERLLALVESGVGEAFTARLVQDDGRRHLADLEFRRQATLLVEDDVNIRPERGGERVRPLARVVDVDGNQRERSWPVVGREPFHEW